jgi:integrase
MDMGAEEYSDVLLNNSWYLRRGARLYIEAHPSVKRMAYSIVGRRRQGSPATVNGYIQGIQKFLKFIGENSPEEALDKIKRGEVDVVKAINREGSGFIDTMLETYANRTVHSHLFGVKKWLEVNEVKVDWDRVEMPTTAVTLEKDRAPSNEELIRLLNHTTQIKDKLVVLMLASSGLRIGTLLSLNWGDVELGYPDVARLTVKREPGRKFSNRGARGGESKLFVTWITPEAKELLLQYRDYRLGRGESVTPESPLIESDLNHGEHMTVSGWHHRWYRILKRAGMDAKFRKYYELHIHVLRKFFRSRCVGVDLSYREHWMGHKGGYLDESYFRADEQRHLSEYRKVIPHLSIYASAVDEEERRKRSLIDFARYDGWKEDKISKLKELLQRKTVDEAYPEFKKLQEEPFNVAPDPPTPNGSIIVNSEEEMLRLIDLNQGWDIVKDLNGGRRFIMRKVR